MAQGDKGLHWRSMPHFPRTFRPIWTFRSSQKLAKILAFVRHPVNSRKRKAYRSRQIEILELGRYITLPRSAPSLAGGIGARSNAIAKHIESRALSLSAIIPNYNHARFLEERIRSIIDQGEKVSELIILDDASSDESRDVIRRITATLPLPVTTVFNESNSGSIFGQWQKGLSLAKGDLVWICESDDSCDPGFLRALIPHFNDPSVMLAFGRIDFIDERGASRHEMNGYMEHSDFWREPRIESAYSWFNGPFGVRNIIANVGGCIFRRQELGAALMRELTSYRICGDWFLYSRLAHGGRIAYDPAARSYFRLHSGNSSTASFKTESFYEEHVRIARALRRHYGLEPATLRLLLQNAWTRCVANLGDSAAQKFALQSSLRDILKEKRAVRHILIATDAGEDNQTGLLPLHLANALSKRGDDISVLVAEHGPAIDQIRSVLSPEIPIFDEAFLKDMGEKTFLTKFGVSLVSAHYLKADAHLSEACRALDVPYLATGPEKWGASQASTSKNDWRAQKVDPGISNIDPKILNYYLDAFSQSVASKH